MATTKDTTDVSSRTDSLVASPAAHAELTWFFNRAEIEVDTPSVSTYIFGGTVSPVSLQSVERRAEAVHAASKIHRWMQAMPPGSPNRLAGLYTEWSCPRIVRRALGRVAGAVAQSPEVQIEYLRALATGRTRVKTAGPWLEERIEEGGPGCVANWRRTAEQQCALALRSYEHVRGSGECAVPDELLKEAR